MKLFHHDLFEHKMLAIINFEALWLLYTNLCTHHFECHQCQPFPPTHKLQLYHLSSKSYFSPKSKNGRVRVYVLGEKIETNGI